VEQTDLLRIAIEMLDRLNIPYMVVGSYASGVYGEPRLTLDIDIVIDPSAEQIVRLCESFSPSDFYCSKEAAAAALQQTNGQFNVIHPASGNKIDFMIAQRDTRGREQLGRRQKRQLFPGMQGYTARPDDVIISKMLYYQEGGSEKHLRDIAGMLKVSGNEIDRAYVDRWATQLDVKEIWEAILKRIGS